MRKKSSFKQYFRHITFKIKPLLFILFLSLFIFLLLQVLNSFYQVKTIQIQGNVNKNKIRGLENLKGQNLIFISDGYIIQTIEDNNPEIELDEAELIYPNKILLKLKPVETVAQLKLNQGFAVLSPDGRIIKKIKQPEKYPQRVLAIGKKKKKSGQEEKGNGRGREKANHRHRSRSDNRAEKLC